MFTHAEYPEVQVYLPRLADMMQEAYLKHMAEYQKMLELLSLNEHLKSLLEEYMVG